MAHVVSISSAQRSSSIVARDCARRSDAAVSCREATVGAAQVLDCTGLNGGPCRDRTYDQLIKSGIVSSPLS
jgi:hypothetical protein